MRASHTFTSWPPLRRSSRATGDGPTSIGVDRRHLALPARNADLVHEDVSVPVWAGDQVELFARRKYETVSDREEGAEIEILVGEPEGAFSSCNGELLVLANTKSSRRLAVDKNVQVSLENVGNPIGEGRARPNNVDRRRSARPPLGRQSFGWHRAARINRAGIVQSMGLGAAGDQQGRADQQSFHRDNSFVTNAMQPMLQARPSKVNGPTAFAWGDVARKGQLAPAIIEVERAP